MFTESEESATQESNREYIDFSQSKPEDFSVSREDDEGPDFSESSDDYTEEETSEETETSETSDETSGDSSEETSEESSEEASDTESESSSDEAADQVDVDSLIKLKIDEMSKGKYESIQDLIDKAESASTETQFKDDFIKKAVDYYNENGNLTPFLEATSLNFEDMTPSEILKYKLKQDNEGLSEKLIDRKFQKEILGKYYQDGDSYHDESDVEFGLEEMTFESNKVRKELIENQKKFISDIKTPESKTESAGSEFQVTPELISFASENVSSFIKEGNISIKIGEDVINIPNADANRIAQMGMNPNAELSSLFTSKNDQGKIDIDWGRMAKVMHYASNTDQFEKQLFDSGQSKARLDIEKELKNPRGRSSQKELKQNHIDNPDFSDRRTQDDFAKNMKIIKR